MERRELFRILAAGAAASPVPAQHSHGAAPLDLSSYKPRFFSTGEYETLDRLCEIIIPADGASPGASEAQVRYYIDVLAHYGDARSKQQWRDGLKSVESAAQASFGKPFIEGSREQQEEIVARMARNEGAPRTGLERFFGLLKRMTIDGYHLSDAGKREGLGYKGDTSVTEFAGCSHPEHR